jgi:esterase/lipase superfamily enzyme
MTSVQRELPKRSERRLSRHAGREVLCCRWGWWGTPVLLFPTAGGDAEEVERMKLVHALRPLLDAGRIKLYSCDSLGGQELTRKGRTTASFAAAQNACDRFVADELVPWIHEDCGGQALDVVTMGASIGAFNAVASLCRHPELFSKAICLSGTYDLTKWLDPPYATDFYFTSPVHFVPNLADGPQLAKLRTRFVLLATGGGPWEEPQQSWRHAQVLGAKGVPNRVDDWGKEYDHDWRTWREMAPKYLA